MPAAIAIDLGKQWCRLAQRPGGTQMEDLFLDPIPVWKAINRPDMAGVDISLKTTLQQPETGVLFRYLRSLASERLGEEVLGVVITHPPSLGNPYRENLRQILIHSGFQAVRMVSEPAALSLYNNSRFNSGPVLIYTLGASDITVSLYEKDGHQFVELASKTQANISGHRITANLAAKLSSHYQSVSKIPQEGQNALYYWRIQAEKAKIQLSKEAEVKVSAPPSHASAAFSPFLITQDDLNEIVSPMISQSIALCSDMLRELHLGSADLDQIWLSGGCKELQLISPMLAEWSGKTPLLMDDRAAVLGAAALISQLVWPTDAPPETTSKEKELYRYLKQAGSSPRADQPAQDSSPEREVLLSNWDKSSQCLAENDIEGSFAAIQAVDALLKKQKARAFYRQGLLLQAQADAPQNPSAEKAIEAAMEAFQQALSLDPDPLYLEAHREAGLAFRHQEARRHFQLGQQAFNRQDWFGASAEFQKARENHPEWAEYDRFYVIAEIQLQGKKFNELTNGLNKKSLDQKTFKMKIKEVLIHFKVLQQIDPNNKDLIGIIKNLESILNQ